MGYYIICDESLASQNNFLRKELSNTKNFLSISSPHKLISVNSIKFSAISCNTAYQDFFEHFIDVYSGGLPTNRNLSFTHDDGPYLTIFNKKVPYEEEQIKQIIKSTYIIKDYRINAEMEE